jgi:preprotein translocase subunit YajC
MGGFLFVILAMFVFMYLLLIRPQRAQQKRHQELLEHLKPGDEVITVGGIYGDVVAVDSDRVHLEIAEDVEIEVAKRAIASVVPPEEQLVAGDEAAEELEAAQAEMEAEAEASVVTHEDGAPREEGARR